MITDQFRIVRADDIVEVHIKKSPTSSEEINLLFEVMKTIICGQKKGFVIWIKHVDSDSLEQMSMFAMVEFVGKILQLQDTISQLCRGVCLQALEIDDAAKLSFAMFKTMYHSPIPISLTDNDSDSLSFFKL